MAISLLILLSFSFILLTTAIVDNTELLPFKAGTIIITTTETKKKKNRVITRDDEQSKEKNKAMLIA